MNRKLQVGQIGVGGFGAYRRERMRETELFDLIAAYDHNPAALQDAQARDGATPCNSYEELLDVPGLEGVVISTGAKFHCEQMMQAMQKGLHVFVEKPLCATPEELSTLIECQSSTGVVIVVGHHDHSTEKYSRHIKALIDNGTLGDIVSVEATTCHSGGMVIREGDWRGDPAKNPGGMLFQCGVHKLHELMYYLGPITRVSAMMRYDVNSKTHTADAAVCNLQFASGVLGSLNAYHITPYKHFINIYGTKANLYYDFRGGDGESLFIQHVAPGYNNSTEEVTSVEVSGQTDHCGNLRSWYRAIREGNTPYPSLHDGARAVAVVFAAEAAAKTGCAIKVDGLAEFGTGNAEDSGR
jgi:predicted dehydrogenase